MSSKKQLKIRLKDCKQQIQLSLDQISAYTEQDNVIDAESLNYIRKNLATLDAVRLRGVCENSINIVQEIITLSRKEIQRRGLEENLAGVESRGAVKKTKRPWYSSDSDSNGSPQQPRAQRPRTK